MIEHLLMMSVMIELLLMMSFSIDLLEIYVVLVFCVKIKKATREYGVARWLGWAEPERGLVCPCQTPKASRKCYYVFRCIESVISSTTLYTMNHGNYPNPLPIDDIIYMATRGMCMS